MKKTHFKPTHMKSHRLPKIQILVSRFGIIPHAARALKFYWAKSIEMLFGIFRFPTPPPRLSETIQSDAGARGNMEYSLINPRPPEFHNWLRGDPSSTWAPYFEASGKGQTSPGQKMCHGASFDFGWCNCGISQNIPKASYTLQIY